jgi:biopolymer transport protein ExbB
MNYYLKVLQNYATFSGRARRREYWYFILFNAIIAIVLFFVGILMGTNILSNIYSLAVLIPNIAVGVRRMHDVGKSGWFILIPIYNLILACTEGTKGENEYGADPTKESGSNLGGMISVIIIALCLIVGWCLWYFIMGAGGNFENGVNTEPPLAVADSWRGYLGMVYKGGIIVPILLGCFLMVLVFSIERFIVIAKAAGKGSLEAFMKRVQTSIKAGNIDEAINACDKQQGSVANAIRSALLKYQDVKKEGFNSEEAAETIHKEIEEATSLEMPMLEQHMTILSTLVSLGTLAGLLGTVTGMIKAFAGLAGGGGADSAELANGISEALINTATGIATSALAIIAYNFFTSKIDSLTYAIDEAGTTIVNTYRHFRGSLKQ